MTLKTLALALAAAALGAHLYHRSRQSRSDAAAESDSPNAAERLQAQQLAGAQAERSDDSLFSSNAQRGPYPETPGLADFSRGA